MARARAKSKATVMVADSAGGMVEVKDRRFEPVADWPICFEVPKEQAETWLRYFYAECAKRGWSSSSICQLEARENSGSIAVNTGGTGQQLAIVWERKAGRPINVRARSCGATEFPLAQAQELFTQANERGRAGVTERFYRRGQLAYEGLAWRGELWLDGTLRLGPPTHQDETALCGPRVILVDCQVECVGQGDAADAFDQKLCELSAFLSVVVGTIIQVPKSRRTWTFVTGAANCEVRSLGYFEPVNPEAMPIRGACRLTPLRPVNRPDFSLCGIDGTANEEILPEDVVDLWQAFRALSSDSRRQFLQAAAKWQEALQHWADQRTLSFALMVVACEALKPRQTQFKDHNIYQVVEALLGKATADRLKEHWFRPQEVRSAHLHGGDLHASEFMRDMGMSSYQDPTFDSAHRELWYVTKAAIIEWLRRGGVFTMPTPKRKQSLRRWAKDHFLSVLAVLTGLGVAAGFILDWLFRALWHG